MVSCQVQRIGIHPDGVVGVLAQADSRIQGKCTVTVGKVEVGKNQTRINLSANGYVAVVVFPVNHTAYIGTECSAPTVLTPVNLSLGCKAALAQIPVADNATQIDIRCLYVGVKVIILSVETAGELSGLTGYMQL